MVVFKYMYKYVYVDLDPKSDCRRQVGFGGEAENEV